MYLEFRTPPFYLAGLSIFLLIDVLLYCTDSVARCLGLTTNRSAMTPTSMKLLHMA